MQKETGSLIPFGYYIIRECLRDKLPATCPTGYLTVAGCLCNAILPDDAMWTTFQEDEAMRKWGLSSDDARRLHDFVIASCDKIIYEFASFTEYSVPQKIVNDFFYDRNDIHVIALCTNDKGFWTNEEIRKLSPLPDHSSLLGWDIYEYGDFVPQEGMPLPPIDYKNKRAAGLGCTFFCCDMDCALPKRLGIQLNAKGMYPDEASASQAAEIINREHLGEPCHYLPFALFKC